MAAALWFPRSPYQTITMRHIGLAFTLVTTVRAACDAVLWQPNSGDTVQEAADALRVDIDTFKHWNPELKNVDNIHTSQTLTVSFTSALDGGAVWVTKGCNRFLHLGGTPTAGHETSFASLTSPSAVSPSGTEVTIPTSPTRSPTSRPIQPSPRQSEDSTPPSSTTRTITTATTASTPTTTTRLEDRPTKDASPTPNLVCDGPRDGPDLHCNAKNDGTFFTNTDIMEKLIKKACDKYGGKFLSADDVIDEAMGDPDKSKTQYQVMAYVDPGDGGTYHRRMPTGQECRKNWRGNFQDCCNGGTGGATRLDNGIVMQYHPLHKGEPPRDAYKIIESWS